MSGSQNRVTHLIRTSNRRVFFLVNQSSDVCSAFRCEPMVPLVVVSPHFLVGKMGDFNVKRPALCQKVWSRHRESICCSTASTSKCSSA